MKKVALFLGLVGFLAGSDADAAPDSMSFTGRLSTSSGPVNGAVNVTFTVFAQGSGGLPVWTDTIALTADQGLVFATLGEPGNPLDETVFTGAGMFLEIIVDAETLSPRLPINSTPYAIRSSGADSADLLGTLSPSDVVTSVFAGAGLTGGGSGNSVSLSIDTAAVQSRVTGTCPSGQSIRTIDASGAVTCEVDDNTTFTQGAGISITGTSIALTTCPANQILKSTGAGYACAADVDTTTTYTAGAGINITGTTVALSTCPAGQVLKSTGASYTCQADVNTTYTATAPIAVSANNFTLTVCGPNQIYKVVGGVWTCAAEGGTTLPTGLIAFFDGACPTGWSHFVALDGRVPVGTNASLSLQLGTPLGDGQTRTITAVPAHQHTVDATGNISVVAGGAHTHAATTDTTGSGHDHSIFRNTGGGGAQVGTDVYFNLTGAGTYNTTIGGAHTHGVTVSSTNSAHAHTLSINPFLSAAEGIAAVDVTMPYIQLRACRKD